MQKLNFLIYGSGDPFVTLKSIENLEGRIFLHDRGDFNIATSEIIPDIIIQDHRLLHMLITISQHKEPTCLLHSGDQLVDWDLPVSIDKILMPKERFNKEEKTGELCPLNISGFIFPALAISSYISMCRSSAIFDGDEETLYRYSKGLLGTKMYDGGFITYWNYEYYGSINRDKLEKYLIRHPKDLKYV